jgi:hypothetical protein
VYSAFSKPLFRLSGNSLRAVYRNILTLPNHRLVETKGEFDAEIFAEIFG